MLIMGLAIASACCCRDVVLESLSVARAMYLFLLARRSAGVSFSQSVFWFVWLDCGASAGALSNAAGAGVGGAAPTAGTSAPFRAILRMFSRRSFLDYYVESTKRRLLST